MKIEYIWYNWKIKINLTYKTISFETAFRDGTDGFKIRKGYREYDIPENPDKVDIEGSYIRIEYPENVMYQFKLEDECALVGDVFKDGEHDESIAMWDFWDDENLN